MFITFIPLQTLDSILKNKNTYTPFMIKIIKLGDCRVGRYIEIKNNFSIIEIYEKFIYIETLIYNTYLL